MRIGELSRELEKAQTLRQDGKFTTSQRWEVETEDARRGRNCCIDLVVSFILLLGS